MNLDRQRLKRVWSPGIKVGPWLFLSGVVGVDFDTSETVGLSAGGKMTPRSIDPEAQWRQCLTNLKVMVEAAGGTMNDIVRADVHVTDMRYYDIYPPLVGGDFKYPIDDSKKIMLDAVAPLGDGYVAAVRKGLEERWMDVYPRPRKLAGAPAGARVR